MAALGHTVDSGSGASGDYASLNALEAAQQQDLTDGGGDTYTATCTTTGDNAADTTAVVMNGWILSATSFFTAQAESSNRASTAWDATKYRLSVSNGSAGIYVQDDFVRMDGLQIEATSTSADQQAQIRIEAVNASNETRISNCFLRQAGNTSFREQNIYSNDSDAIITIWNTIGVGGAVFGSSTAGAFMFENFKTANIYNCTVEHGYQGIRAHGAGGTANVYNCYAAGANGGASYSQGSGTIVVTTSAANDTTGDPAGLDSIAYSTSNFVNVTGGSEDFALPSGSALVGVGTDTPPGYLESTDIDGTERTSTWDVGVFEFVAAGGGVNVAPLLRHRRQMVMR